jgi:hypothetical protein
MMILMMMMLLLMMMIICFCVFAQGTSTVAWVKYLSVVHDGEKFLLFYGRSGLPRPPTVDPCGLSLATSLDGIKWADELVFKTDNPRCATFQPGSSTLPSYNAVTLTNFGIWGDGELCVTFDRHEPERWRYKMGYQCHRMQICLAYSEDGRVWSAYDDGKPVFGRGSDTYLCVHHLSNSTYVLYGRAEVSTDVGWREIRGVNVASGELDFEKDRQKRHASQQQAEQQVGGTSAKTASTDSSAAEDSAQIEEMDGRDWSEAPEIEGTTYPMSLVSTWYLDGEGKLERYSRQIYSLSISRTLYNNNGRDNLYVGIAQVLEYPKVTNVDLFILIYL